MRSQFDSLSLSLSRSRSRSRSRSLSLSICVCCREEFGKIFLFNCLRSPFVYEYYAIYKYVIKASCHAIREYVWLYLCAYTKSWMIAHPLLVPLTHFLGLKVGPVAHAPNAPLLKGFCHDEHTMIDRFTAADGAIYISSGNGL